MNNLKKHLFSFDLAALSTYTDEVGGLLISEAIAKGKTAEVITIQSGVKGTQSLNLLSSTLNVQNGTCGWDPSGTTTYTQRNITTCQYKVNEALCGRDLLDYWQGQFINGGDTVTTLPFEAQIADLKVKQIQKYIEDEIWQATTGTTCFPGLKTLISTGTTGVNAVVGATGLTASNALTQVDNVIAKLPNSVLDDADLVVFMSMQAYRTYVVALRSANYFHYSPEEAGREFVTYHPATKIRVMGVPGIPANSNYIACGKTSYMVLGVNLMDDSEKLDMFYSRDYDEVRVRSNFSFGVQIAFPNTFVTNNLA